MIKIVILQPSYIPWLGYFEQIAKSDIFVFLDDVLYTKNDWRNRNKIKTQNGPTWLTLPVNAKNRISTNLLIKDVNILDLQIFEKHLSILSNSYKKAEYFPEFHKEIEKILTYNSLNLSDINIQIIKNLSKLIGIKNKKFIKSSDLKLQFANPTDRLVQICKKLNGNYYITGNSAKNYLDLSQFKKNHIKVEFQEYSHPIYSQLWGDFIPYLSILDLLYNVGPNALKIIKSKK